MGTRISIYLPAIEERGKTAKRDGPAFVRDAGVILLIEDEEMVRDVCCAFPEKMGYQVLKTNTGRGTMDTVEAFEGEIDLALLDMVLPGMGGKEIYRRLMEARPGLKVIVYSGFSVDGPVQEILDLGAQGFIQKPFTFERLGKKVAEVLKGVDDRIGN